MSDHVKTYTISHLARLVEVPTSIGEVEPSSLDGELFAAQVDELACQACVDGEPCVEPVGYALVEQETASSHVTEGAAWHPTFYIDLDGDRVLICEDCAMAVDMAGMV